MKKSAWIYYMAATGFLVVAVMKMLSSGFSEAVIWMCMGSMFLCIGAGIHSKEETEESNRGSEIKIVPAYRRTEEVGRLFSEYTEMLRTQDPSIQEYLNIQNYEEEIQNLKVKYGMPDGRLYLAYCKGIPAGCIALRKIDDENCEIKRLYVRPQFRREKIGNLLMERVIQDARSIGYSYMLLDTLPFLESAIYLYQKYGFYEIERYNDSPMSSSIYMKLDLKK